jgi:hypothetical protein
MSWDRHLGRRIKLRDLYRSTASRAWVPVATLSPAGRGKSYFVFENSAFSLGPVSALWRMMPSQPAS